ncbi:transketolase [bacterium]|nr:transketolase [Gammaproteobacteria bacterium]MDB0028721.1 transketolase [bacterium]
MRNTCFEMIHLLAKQDERVIFIGSDLSPGLLGDMQEEMPDRFFMEGISEANIIGMSAGLAMDGFIPYVVTIGTFITRRCYEQIAVDLCLHDLPVRLIGIGGGLNYAPLGPTHQSIEDISLMRSLPNMQVFAPCDAEEMKRFMPETLKNKSPIYIRLAKGYDPVISDDSRGFTFGKAITISEADESENDVLLLSTGIMTQESMIIQKALSKENINTKILHIHTVKPLDSVKILKEIYQSKLVVTLEEHTLIGGLGSSVVELLSDSEKEFCMSQIMRFGLPDKFVEDYGTQESLLLQHGLDADSITKKILHRFKD